MNWTYSFFLCGYGKSLLSNFACVFAYGENVLAFCDIFCVYNAYFLCQNAHYICYETNDIACDASCDSNDVLNASSNISLSLPLFPQTN